jgi:hypothetical protein
VPTVFSSSPVATGRCYRWWREIRSVAAQHFYGVQLGAIGASAIMPSLRVASRLSYGGAMLIKGAGRALGYIFYQRCFYLFLVLMSFIAAVPFIDPTPLGRIAIIGVNAFLVVATVASVGRTTLSFVLALVLAGPALVYQWIALRAGDQHALVMSRWFGAALYATAIGYMMRYVFQRKVMTADKLFGAASMYLLIGVSWAFLYALIDNYHPGSFTFGGQPTAPTLYDLVYFSFTVLTSTGFGDLAPLGRQARGICMVEQIVGSLFVAILIARLAGIYPPDTRVD